ncbi:MAG: PKD domain-containing protein [Halorientalis sp.]
MTRTGVRRGVVLAIAVLVALSSGPIIGAFTSTAAKRSVDVTVTGDEDALLAITPHAGPNGAYAKDVDGDGTVEILLNGAIDSISGQGVNQNAVTRIDRVVNITNRGTQPVTVTIEDDSPQVTFYGGSGDVNLETDGKRIGVGETVEVGIETDVTDATNVSLQEIQITATANPETNRGSTGLDTGSGSNGSGNGDGGRGSVSPSVTAVGPNTVTTASRRIDANGTATYSLPETEHAERTGVRFTELSMSLAAERTISPTLRQPDVPANGTDLFAAGAHDERLLSYFEVSHPNVTDSQLSNATFSIAVRKSKVDGDPDSFTLYRHTDQGWESVQTTFERETGTSYLYSARTPGLSWFSVAWDQVTDSSVPTHPDAIDDVSVTHKSDLDSDGVVSDFDLAVEARTNFDGLDPHSKIEPQLVVSLDGKQISTTDVARTSDGQFVVPFSWNALSKLSTGENQITVELRDADWGDSSETGYDPIATQTVTVHYEPIQHESTVSNTAVELIRYSNNYYSTTDTKTLSEEWWQRSAERNADVAAKQARDIVKSLVPTPPSPAEAGFAAGKLGLTYKYGQAATGAFAGYATGLQFLHVAKGAIFMGVAIQKKAVQLHLNRRGMTADSYDRLHAQLTALEDNGERLKTAIKRENETRKQRLLGERKRHLERLAETLPTYLKGYHRSVVRNAAGGEDLRSYSIMRTNIEDVRRHVTADYRLTTAMLDGNQSSLAASIEMPTHGWRLAHKTVVYDTFEQGGDHTTYRIRVPESEAGKPFTVRIEGGAAAGYDATIGRDEPTDATIEDGQRFKNRTAGGFGRQSFTIDDPKAGSYYVAVDADRHTGAYRLVVDRPLPVSILARQGPDVQRPVVSLVDAPRAKTLHTGKVVHVTENSSVHLAWHSWDDKTVESNLRYSLRVDNGSGFTDWTPWRNVTEDGRIEHTYDFADGVHRVQLRVIDQAHMQAVRNVDVVVSKFTPQVALAAEPNATSNDLFVRVLPDRRVDRVVFEYRPANTSANWTRWQTITDTSGLDELQFPKPGEYEVRARAVTLTNRSSEWTSTSIVYLPPDTTPPKLALADAPARDEIRDGKYQRITSAETVSIDWTVDPTNSPIDATEYRIRTDGNWSGWHTVPADRRIETTLSPAPGSHTVEVAVRDAAGNTAADSVSFTVDRTAPETRINATGAVTGAVVATNTSERVDRVTVQYYHNGTWKRAGRFGGAGSHEVNFPSGSIPVRARSTDFAENQGPWSTVVTVASFPANTSESHRDYNESVPTNGSTTTIDPPSLGGGGGGGGGRYLMDMLVGWLDGDVLLDIYMETRDGREIKVESITFTKRGNQTVAVDLPPALRNDTELKLRAHGNGSVVLDSVRGIDAAPGLPPLRVSPATPTVGTNVTLSTVPEGPDGYIQQIAWRFGTDSSVDATGKRVTWQPAQAGNRSINLTVTDIFGASTTNTTVIPVNYPPTARISGNLTAKTYQTIHLSGNTSSDRDGNLTAYEWAANGTSLSQTGGTTTTLTGADDGTYPISLRVVDDTGAADRTNATVTVRNRRPNVRASGPEGTPVVGTEVSLSAADSTDRDGSVASYAWDIDDDGTFEKLGTRASPTFDSAGYKRVRVRATDDDGASNTTALSFYVTARPDPTFSLPGSVLTEQSAVLNASATTDPDGQITRYEWDVDDDGQFERSGVKVAVSFADDGTYNLTLRVTDNNGTSATRTRQLSVENRPPNATITHRPTVPNVDQAVTFDASGSTDRDGSTTAFAWDVDGDGDVERTGTQIDQTYHTPGNHTVRVRVTDDDGATAVATHTVHVNQPPNPVLEKPDSVPTLTRFEINASGSVDPDGTITDYQWDVDGDGQFDRSGLTVHTSFSDNGSYPIRLRVTDDRGVSETTTVRMTVRNRPPQIAGGFEYVPVIPNVGETVTLDASALTDRDGSIDDYAWSIGTNRTVDAHGKTAERTFASAGNQSVTLRVVDDDGATNRTTRTIHVNRVPIARVDAPDAVLTGDQATLNATGSTDPDGHITSVTWDLDDDGRYERTGNVTSVSFPDNGTYPIGVRVTDDAGATNTTRTVLRVENRPPSVDLVAPSEVRPNRTFTLDAPGTDPDGTIVSYEWTVGGTTVTTTSATSEWNLSTPGDTPLTVTAVDDDGATAVVNATVHVDAPPKPAVTLDKSVLTEVPVSLNTTVSDPDDAGPFQFVWDVRNNGTIDRQAQNTTVRFADDGTYEIALTVYDDLGASTTVVRSVTVENRPPFVDPWTSDRTVDAGEPVTFDVGQSYDPDGTIESVVWNATANDSRVSSGPQVNWSFDSGTHRVVLDVTDDDGRHNTTSVTIDVNARPNATFESNSPAFTGSTLRLNATATDADGNLTTYQWDVRGDQRPLLSGPNVTTSFADDGNYSVNLTVIDDDGATDTITSNVTIQNRRPDPAIDASSTLLNESEPVTLQANRSVDPDGEIVAYDWQIQNTNQTVSGKQFYTRFATPGVFTVTLTTTDDDNATAETNLTVRVRDVNQSVLWSGVYPDSFRVLSVTARSLFVGNYENVTAIEPATGTQRWSVSAQGYLGLEGVSGGAAVLRSDGDIQVRDATTGSVYRTFEDARLAGVYDGMAYLRTENGGVVVYDGSTGTVQQTFSDGWIAESTNESVLVNHDQNTTILDATTGTIEWTFSDSYVRTVRDDIAFVSGETFRVVDLSAGRVIHRFREYPRLYTVDRGPMYIETSTAVVQISPETGQIQQTLNETSVVTNTANVTLLRTSDHLVAYDRSGTVEWRVPVSGYPDVGRVRRGTLYVSNDQRVRKIDADTGAVEWTVQASYPDVLEATTDRVYLDTRSGLVAVDAASGAREWNSSLDGFDVAAFGTDRVYVSTIDYNSGNRTYRLRALDRTTGTSRWNVSLPGYGQVRDLNDSSLLVTTTQYDGTASTYRLAAIGVSNGSLLWNRSTVSRAWLDGFTDQTVILDRGGRTIGLDRRTGATQFNLSGDWNFVTVARGTAVFRDYDSNVTGVDLRTGTRLWTVSGTDYATIEALVGSYAYIQTDDRVVTINVTDGSVVTSLPSQGAYISFSNDSKELRTDVQTLYLETDGKAAAVDAATASIQTAVSGRYADVQVAGDLAVLETDDQVSVVDADTGTVNWHETNSEYLSVADVRSGLVYVRSNASARVVDGETGTVLARFSGRYPDLVVETDTAFVLANGTLSGLEPTTGRVLWARQYDGSWMIGTGADVAFVLGNNVLTAFEGDGTVRWNETITGLRDIAVEPGVVYALGSDGLFALDRSTGRQTAAYDAGLGSTAWLWGVVSGPERLYVRYAYPDDQQVARLRALDEVVNGG